MAPLSGKISQQPLIRVLAEVLAKGRSGVLKLTQGAKTRQLFMDGGKIIRYAASNLLAESISEQLKKQNRFDKEQMRKATTAKQRAELLSTALHRLGFLTDEEHRTLVHGVIEKVVASAARWSHASYEYQLGELPFQQPGDVGIPIPGLILALAREMVDPAPLRDLLGGGKRKLKLNPALPFPLEMATLEPAEGYLVSRVDGTLSIQEVAQTSPLDALETERALCGMILAGILVTEAFDEDLPEGNVSRPKQRFLNPPSRAGAPGGSTSSIPHRSAGPVEEMLERHAALKDQNFYEILGLEPAAKSSEIRHGYYSLAKRLHPDKFFEEEAKGRAEKLFAAITEAYATLSKPEGRKAYDESGIFAAKVEAEAAGESELARQNFLRGKALLGNGEVVKSLGFFKNAVEQEDGKEEYWHYLGLVQSRNPRFRKDAEQAFLRAIQLDPSRAENYAQLGLLYRKMGQADQASTYLQKALSWDKANPTALGALAAEPKKGRLRGFFGR